jgi:hypothetical protein
MKLARTWKIRWGSLAAEKRLATEREGRERNRYQRRRGSEKKSSKVVRGALPDQLR